MKKKDFLFLLLTTVAGLMFALGMCMCLVPEWNLFKPGVVVTGLKNCKISSFLQCQ